MSDLKYERVDPIGKDQAIRALEDPDPEVVANALYAAARSDEDTRWLEEECLKRLTSPELKIRWAAATCLGDLAFFRRPLDVRKVIPALEAATQDPTIPDPASFSLSMVRQFST
jgi:HEAT repeat protein